MGGGRGKEHVVIVVLPISHEDEASVRSWCSQCSCNEVSVAYPKVATCMTEISQHRDTQKCHVSAWQYSATSLSLTTSLLQLLFLPVPPQPRVGRQRRHFFDDRISSSSLFQWFSSKDEDGGAISSMSGLLPSVWIIPCRWQVRTGHFRRLSTPFSVGCCSLFLYFFGSWVSSYLCLCFFIRVCVYVYFFAPVFLCLCGFLCLWQRQRLWLWLYMWFWLQF